MGIKYYKLTQYDPFWIHADGKYPRKHIEQILIDRGIADTAWVPTKNYQWTDIDNLSATGFAEDIGNYIKVDVNGDIYYYYLLNKSAILASKDNKTQYRAVYELDEYMTVYHSKLEILRQFNPNVYVNMGFLNRWAKKYDSDTNAEYYVIDYIQQKYLGNTINDRNCMLVRKQAYSTTAPDIFSLNFPNSSIPASITINRYNTGSDAITIDNLESKLNTPNSRGRYLYFIAKSTAKMKSNNDSLQKAHTDQQFVVIPFFAGSENDIWHALNDFDTTIETDGFLVPSGDNEIGLWECDIPYSFFYGCVANNLYGAKMEYAHQPMGAESFINVPFFTIDNNAPIIFKIIDYSKYGSGFFGKFAYMLRNITKWTPETEPTMWCPKFYQEVYNNGESEIAIDTSMFVFTWNDTTQDVFGTQAYLSLSSNLVLAYNFGENTNSALATFDNTETILGKGSITNMYMGSNSANYFTTNASSIATSLANRQSEETQAWVDASLNTAKIAVNSSPNGIAELIFSTGKAVKRIATAAIDTAKIMTDTALTQQRANRDFNSSINNITSAPSQTLADPNVKGVIPNKHGLFETYSKELHDTDKLIVFNSILHNGYVINYVCKFNDVADNRVLMNIINLNTTYFADDLSRLIVDHDTTIFNNKFWIRKFLAFLNTSSNIYETDYLINCTDYSSDDYHSNIEKELPKTPNPLQFTAIEDNTEIGYTITGSLPNIQMQYSYDLITWEDWDGTPMVINKDETIYIRNRYNQLSLNIQNFIIFTTSKECGCSGNIMSLINYSDLTEYCFHNLFTQTLIISAPELPAMTLADSCYNRMFYECTSLISAPELPAMTLADSCYGWMFAKCSSLISVPELPAMTLADSCYYSMFNGCTSLKIGENSGSKLIFDLSRFETLPTDATLGMFNNTGGSFIGTPTIPNKYYLE